jgi:hypothetical protein
MAFEIVAPFRTRETASEAIACVSLHLCDASVDFAARAFAFDVAPTIVASKAEAESTGS